MMKREAIVNGIIEDRIADIISYQEELAPVEVYNERRICNSRISKEIVYKIVQDKNISASAILVFLYLSQRQDDEGLVMMVYYKDVCKTLDICFQTYYMAIDYLIKNNYISELPLKRNTTGAAFNILNNVYMTSEDDKKPYLNLNFIDFEKVQPCTGVHTPLRKENKNILKLILYIKANFKWKGYTKCIKKMGTKEIDMPVRFTLHISNFSKLLNIKYNKQLIVNYINKLKKYFEFFDDDIKYMEKSGKLKSVRILSTNEIYFGVCLCEEHNNKFFRKTQKSSFIRNLCKGWGRKYKTEIDEDVIKYVINIESKKYTFLHQYKQINSFAILLKTLQYVIKRNCFRKEYIGKVINNNIKLAVKEITEIKNGLISNKDYTFSFSKKWFYEWMKGLEKTN